MTFADAYCSSHRVRPEDYEHIVFLRTLHPVARIFRGTLGLIPRYFAADHSFIRSVGALTRRRDFGLEELDYVHDPANRGFLRRKLRLRVSARRLYALVRAELPHDTGAAPVSTQSLAPWPTGSAPAAPSAKPEGQT